jgi:hypothetical protein
VTDIRKANLIEHARGLVRVEISACDVNGKRFTAQSFISAEMMSDGEDDGARYVGDRLVREMRKVIDEVGLS